MGIEKFLKRLSFVHTHATPTALRTNAPRNFVRIFAERKVSASKSVG